MKAQCACHDVFGDSVWSSEGGWTWFWCFSSSHIGANRAACVLGKKRWEHQLSHGKREISGLYWKDLLPKWLEFRHSVDGGIVVTVGWWLRFWEDNIHPKAIEFNVEIFVAKPEHKPREPWKQQESNREVWGCSFSPARSSSRSWKISQG